jgi:uncharacterized protein (TIGR03067 family)
MKSVVRDFLSAVLWPVIVVSCVVFACDTSRPANRIAAGDAGRWQGTWRLVSATQDGEPRMADVWWVVNGDQYTVHLGESQETWTFTLDPARKQVDANHHTSPPGTSGGKLRGIYGISQDYLLICYDLTGRQYPTSFESRRGSRRVVYRFRRQ